MGLLSFKRANGERIILYPLLMESQAGSEYPEPVHACICTPVRTVAEKKYPATRCSFCCPKLDEYDIQNTLEVIKIFVSSDLFPLFNLRGPLYRNPFSIYPIL